MTSPVTSFLIAFSSGIIAGKLLSIPNSILFMSMLIAFFCSAFLIKRGGPPLLMIIMLIFLAGIFAYNISSLPPPKNDISFFADGFKTVEGRIADEPVVGDGKTSFTINAETVLSHRRTFKVSGKARVYLKGERKDICYGGRIRIKGDISCINSTENFDIMSYADLMKKKGVYAQVFGNAAHLAITDKNGGNMLKKVIIIIKNRLLYSLKNTLFEPYSSLLGSIIFGTAASPIPDDIKESYRTAGVVHLLVVSGTQVSILLGVTVSMLKLFGIKSAMRVAIASIFNLLFIIMVGAGPSIVRAGIMAEAGLLSRILQRSNDFYNSLSLSALILLLLNPLTLFDVGFQLSFLATWALFYVAPAIEDRLISRVPPFLANLIALGIGPTLATTPISFYNFGQISFVSIFANMAIIPWIETIVVLGFLSTMIGIIVSPAALVINSFLFLVLKLLNSMVFFFSHLPFACRYIVPPALPLILSYYIILIMAVEMIKGKLHIRLDKFKFAAIFLAILSVFVWNFAASAITPVASLPLKAALTITVIDVGQGDSILVQAPSGRTMLIDGGGSGGRSVVPYIQKQGINELDAVVLTHPHDDHVGGLPSVIDKIPVKLVIDSGKPHTSYTYRKFLEKIDAKNIRYQLGRAGQTIDLGGSIEARILYPTDRIVNSSDTELNNVSIVIRISYGNFSMLLPGDLGEAGERSLLRTGVDIRSTVLKVGHHGSSTSTSYQFLKKVKPKYAVIPVGIDNSFGHPSQKALERLQDAGAKVYRTDLNGAVMIRTDGEKLSIQTAR